VNELDNDSRYWMVSSGYWLGSFWNGSVTFKRAPHAWHVGLPVRDGETHCLTQKPHIRLKATQ
jgi:hypothetical protein